MSKITNEQKYKTIDERVSAFHEWCNKQMCNHRDKCTSARCAYNWLALQAEEEKPEPCYGCGSPLTDFDIAYKSEQEGQYSGYSYHCVKCGFRTPYFRSKDELVAAHNRVARAVRAAMEREVK